MKRFIATSLSLLALSIVLMTVVSPASAEGLNPRFREAYYTHQGDH
jgi:hypothetical protein